jgi:hypothetical protein
MTFMSFIVFTPDTYSAIAPLWLPTPPFEIKDAAADPKVLRVG